MIDTTQVEWRFEGIEFPGWDPGGPGGVPDLGDIPGLPDEEEDEPPDPQTDPEKFPEPREPPEDEPEDDGIPPLEPGERGGGDDTLPDEELPMGEDANENGGDGGGGGGSGRTGPGGPGSGGAG